MQKRFGDGVKKGQPGFRGLPSYLKAKLYLFQLKTRSLYIAAVGSNHYMELAGFVYILYVVVVELQQFMDGRSLLPLAKGMETNWRKYLDLEHATCYSDDNYWCALTDGKIKYIWRIHTGTEELFDLTQDPQELHNAVNDKKYRKQLTEMRNEMIRHLSERGEEFVKDGRLVVKEKTMLYGPHYPEKENKR